MGICDAHNHLWISRVDGSAENSPVLADETIQLKELIEYRHAGGNSQIDCQPGGAGRNAHRLFSLSKKSAVNIVACTGFHLSKYYPSDFWLFNTTAVKAADYFIDELTIGVTETLDYEKPIKAGFIKIACRETYAEMPLYLLEATTHAARQVKCAIEMHTEKGSQAEIFVNYFLRYGIQPEQLIVCHVDKRADFGLHSELAKAGVLLEYDTFFRPKYDPDHHVWPLIEKMLTAGYNNHLALATDMAEASLWKQYSAGPGLAGLPGQILPRLKRISGENSASVKKLMGENVARALATFSN